MALYRKKGSRIYNCKFDYKGKEIRRSTGVTNKRDALKVQARILSELSLGRWGILEEHKPDITLQEFLDKHFVTGEIKPATKKYYEFGIENSWILTSPNSHSTRSLAKMHNGMLLATSGQRASMILTREHNTSGTDGLVRAA